MPEIEVAERRRHPLSEFFDDLRQTRREKRAAPGTRQRGAVLTIVRDEPVFFPIWLRYYSRHFDPQDIHVLDHGSTDASIDAGGFVRIPIEHDTVDNLWMVGTVEAHQRRLLEEYDVVLTVDCDEIVAPDPALGTLAEYVAGFREGFVNCLGYEVLHLADREPPFDPSRPVLEQRGYWSAADGYDKPALATEPISWTVGFHGRTDDRLNLDPDLYLIHLHRMDFEICRRRHARWRDWAWNEQDLEESWGTHNRIAGDEEFERWFYTGTCFQGENPVAIERIPARWRGLF